MAHSRWPCGRLSGFLCKQSARGNIPLRQGRTLRYVGRIALTHKAVLGRVSRILSPASVTSAVCHISIRVYGRSSVVALAPLSVDSQPCTAPCLPRAYRLEVAGAAVGSWVYPVRHRRRCACLYCKFRYRGRRALLRLLLLRQHLRSAASLVRGG